MQSRQEEIETIAELAMAPLVEVAWADGAVTPGERAAVLEATRTLGLEQRSEFCKSTLRRWLDERPPSEAFERWRRLLGPTLAASETRPAQKVVRRLAGEALRIAKMDERPFDVGASVDAGAGVTAEEQIVIDELARVLEGLDSGD